MRTKFITTLAGAVLLTVCSAAVALAEAPDVQANAQGSATAPTAGANPSHNPSADNGGFAPNVGFSAHYHPHGVRDL